MKINVTQRITADSNLVDLLKRIAYQVNLLSEGALVARYTARTAAPTTGKYARGDFIANSEPSELGAVGSKYVITGFLCVVGGEPGTFVQTRALTGN